MTQSDYSHQAHSKIRVRNRAHYDRKTVHSILDMDMVAHVGFMLEGRPMVIPMAYVRCGETIYIHGAKASRIIKSPAQEAPICLTVTHLDGIVVARSAFHHSMNYRSVVVHGKARAINNPEQKQQAMIALTNQLLPNRWDEVRPMTDKELRATGILAIEIETASAKMRQGPPIDDKADYALPIWAGVLPIQQTIGPAVVDEHVMKGVETPKSVEAAKSKFG